MCIILYIYSSYSDKLNESNKIQLKVISLFLLYVGVMQFWDILFWTNDETTNINKYATKMAMIWNNFEPIILFLLILYYNNYVGFLSISTIILYSILMILYTIYNWNKVTKTGKYYRKEKNKEVKNSLFWEWNYMEWSYPFYTFFLITLVFLSYENFCGPVRVLSLSFILFTFFFSLYKYKIDKSVGRFWCYFAAYGPIFFLLLSFFISLQ
jgi:hypothetical protein